MISQFSFTIYINSSIVVRRAIVILFSLKLHRLTTLTKEAIHWVNYVKQMKYIEEFGALLSLTL